MIPRNLPPLAKSAIEHGWDVDIEQSTYYRSALTVRAYFYRSDAAVSMVWEKATGRLITSELDETRTPYAQCTRLIRSPEGA